MLDNKGLVELTLNFHLTVVNIHDRVWKMGSRDEICWIFGHVEPIGHYVQNVINSLLNSIQRV